MLLSVKRFVVLVAMALALVAGLVGWTVRMATIQLVPQYHVSAAHSSQIADDPDWYCPAPPRMC